MEKSSGDIKAVLGELIRGIIPELNGFQWPIKAKVTKLHESGGRVSEFQKFYSVNVQPLKADGSTDEEKPEIPDVPIDILWAGAKRGVLSLPPVGAIVRVEFYYWDPSHPYVSAILADGYSVPDHPAGSFIIQQKEGVVIKIQPGGDIEIETKENVKIKAGKAQMTLESGGAINIGPNRMTIGAGGEISFAGGGPAVARVGDQVRCSCGTGTIISGSGKVDCGG